MPVSTQHRLARPRLGWNAAGAVDLAVGTHDAHATISETDGARPDLACSKLSFGYKRILSINLDIQNLMCFILLDFVSLC